jgi:acyl carrier protein
VDQIDAQIDHLLETFRTATEQVMGPVEIDIQLNSEIASLGIKSLDLIEIAMEIEEELGVVLRLEDFAEVLTVGDALAVAAAKTAEGRA